MSVVPARRLWFAGLVHVLAVCGHTIVAWEGHSSSRKSMKSIGKACGH